MKLEISSHKLQSIKCVTEGVAILEVEGVAIFEIRARVVQGRASLRGRGSILTGTTWEVVAAELGTQFPIRTAFTVESRHNQRIRELATHLPRGEFDDLPQKYSIGTWDEVNGKRLVSSGKRLAKSSAAPEPSSATSADGTSRELLCQKMADKKRAPTGAEDVLKHIQPQASADAQKENINAQVETAKKRPKTPVAVRFSECSGAYSSLSCLKSRSKRESKNLTDLA